MGWFKHAFAVEKPGPVEPTPKQQVPVDWLSRKVVKHHVATPAIVALEVCRPLNFFASQFMHIMGPAVWALSPPETYEHYKNLAFFLEKRGSVDHLCRRIEELEAECEKKEWSERG